MEIMISLMTTISSGLFLIIAYFLKSVFADVKKLKEAEVELALLKQSVNVVQSDIKNHHGKIGAQVVKSNELQTSLLLMRNDIKQILLRLPKND